MRGAAVCFNQEPYRTQGVISCPHTAAGCADTVDIGETSYATVVADDLDNDGKMDLVLSTMNGNVYCFHTAASYHPLKAWPTPVSSCQLSWHHQCDLKLVCTIFCSQHGQV